MSSQLNSADDDSDNISRESAEKGGVESKVPGVILKDAELVTAKGNVITKDGVVISTKETDASLSTNVFTDPEIKTYYIGVYEKAKYECRHVFDANLTWTKAEEKKLIRKLDWHGMHITIPGTRQDLTKCHVLQSVCGLASCSSVCKSIGGT